MVLLFPGAGPGPLVGWGKLEERQGNTFRAMQLYKRALERDSHWAPALQVLAVECLPLVGHRVVARILFWFPICMATATPHPDFLRCPVLPSAAQS